ncbi:MAG: hypothetical protein ACFE0R_20865 [Salinarimonas sp.]
MKTTNAPFSATAAVLLLCSAPAFAQVPAQQDTAQDTAQDDAMLSVFGRVAPLNDAQTTMQDPHGEVRIVPFADRLEIAVYARGLEPGMHRTLVYGFPGDRPREARCPTQSADINEDGWVDLAEARLVAGEALIPLTADTVSLSYDSAYFPEAGTWGVADFETLARLDELREALRERHGTPLALARRVVLIHGVAEGTELPRTVYAPEGLSAQEAVPVACAELDPSDERPL